MTEHIDSIRTYTLVLLALLVLTASKTNGKEGRLFCARTTDGGLHWVRQVSGTQNDLYGVSTVDATNGTVVGANRTILHTTNGGTAWTLQSSSLFHRERSAQSRARDRL